MVGSKALEILLGERLGHLQVERIVGVEEHAGRIEPDPTTSRNRALPRYASANSRGTWPMNPWKSGAIFSPTLRPYSVNRLARSAWKSW